MTYMSNINSFLMINFFKYLKKSQHFIIAFIFNVIYSSETKNMRSNFKNQCLNTDTMEQGEHSVYIYNNTFNL